jgi:hypothetical protein
MPERDSKIIFYHNNLLIRADIVTVSVPLQTVLHGTVINRKNKLFHFDKQGGPSCSPMSTLRRI